MINQKIFKIYYVVNMKLNDITFNSFVREIISNLFDKSNNIKNFKKSINEKIILNVNHNTNMSVVEYFYNFNNINNKMWDVVLINIDRIMDDELFNL